MTTWIFNREIAENYIDIGNKESFFEYHEAIKCGWSDQIYHKALRALLDWITLTVFDHPKE